MPYTFQKWATFTAKEWKKGDEEQRKTELDKYNDSRSRMVATG